MSQLHTRSLLLAATLSASLLAGCGMGGATVGLQGSQVASFDTLASATLRKGFKEVHMAIFSRIDTNGDNFIDEYEAGPFFDLIREFPKADRGKNGRGNGKISRTEFMRYATNGGFLVGKDNPERFLTRMRSFLATAFNRLDQKEGGFFGRGDGYLTQQELSSQALRSLGLGFAYEKLHVRVRIDEVTPDDFMAADVTGDGRLSQGEWEDLYMKLVVRAINPNAGGAPMPPADPGFPDDPIGDPGADPGAGLAPDTRGLWEWWRL